MKIWKTRSVLMNELFGLFLRTNLICLDAKLASARETDSTLYQVEISVAFDPDVHRPIRLERIAPSYRYNHYLAYDALGINCGVRRRGLIDATVLETTSLPIYYQPLIRQFDLPTPPNFEVLGANDGGLDMLRGLLDCFRRLA